MLEKKSYITAVPFSALYNWSVQYLNETKISFNSTYPMVKIGDFLTRNKTAITINDSEIYKRVTIKVRNGGVVQRDSEVGRNIGTKKQFLVSEGQFILSKIDARNGAMGIIPAELEKAIVTQDFLPYDIDSSKINPKYLVLVSTTEAFVEFCQTCSSGTTNRQRVEEAKFLNIKIPLPTIEEQNKLVAEYNKKIELAAKQETQATAKELEIEEYIFDKLEIKHTENKILKGLRFAKFSNLEKWGLEHISKDNLFDSAYKTVKISSLCKISSGGTPSRSIKEYYNGNIPWIKTGELNNNVIYDTEEKITQYGLENSSAKLYPIDSIIIAMYGATIGKTAKLGIPATTNQACAVLFNINAEIIKTDYIWVYLQSQTEKLKQMAYGSAQPNLNAGIIANYKIPLPPIDIQTEIVAHISDLKQQIKDLRTQAEHNRTIALVNFEKNIF